MKKQNTISVVTATFEFELSTEVELRALRWANHLAGTAIEFSGGSELEVEVDAARDRLWIEGWHIQRGEKLAVETDAESGFLAGYHRFEYPDILEHEKDAACWAPSTGTFNLMEGSTHWAWARARFFLPEASRGEPLLFTLGGFGVGDFRHTLITGRFQVSFTPRIFSISKSVFVQSESSPLRFKRSQ